MNKQLRDIDASDTGKHAPSTNISCPMRRPMPQVGESLAPRPAPCPNKNLCPMARAPPQITVTNQTKNIPPA
jgi:hypothetical protein